ncbi:similar to Saccharomyces cerevisiae YDR427W RPN9 Non-ATPase regulatory subunit of the 26S proteasome, has similarity to putative proteasomal subunits in other species [Maudiozyma saulgeensis]|uniref:Similar to Saccharomyces cerevisiae YDR427W RPN9 Non-ATPase regulatory subunit of the 26S proteasome, has similarity to putative proteasomal subunits in other species n=1 Tax=Maudiozyma saulgeensis TaxID=1789683 RepID=A0A1X7R1S6_9SACH|nr:similar to Saccharomyces cerevisiae YDR427W RPN9 Non-ATPase regulatory subunit of the 26S proteasome, has similarity to putative proteasomal subunits in other species [Kazachstania saulgeensis]
MSNHEIDTILSTLRLEANPELSSLFEEFESCYEQKLWHQLTLSLKKFFEDERAIPLRLRVYDTFVSKFIDKINQLNVIEFLLLSLKNNSNYDESINYLNQLKDVFKITDEKRTRNDGLPNHNDGRLLIDIEIARIYLFQGDLVKARDSLDEFDKILESVDTLPLLLVNTFYSVNALYYKLKKDFNNFYYTSLLFLSTMDKEFEMDLTSQENRELAFDLSIAALLGDKIYNFGELLQHPIMSSISNNKEFDWLFNLLNALTNGDFETFDSIINLQIPKTPILAAHESFLRQKICLMTLVESVFSRNIRTLSFDDIAKATHLPKDNVEHLVMRSISLGLLKGSIDQVNEIVSITWVQPRIISFNQIEKMNDRLYEWNDQVSRLGEKLEERGRSIWV